MPIRFSCPHCHKHLSIGSHKGGTSIFCPVCAGSVTVPAQKSLSPPLTVPVQPGKSRFSRKQAGVAGGLAMLLVAGLAAIAAWGPRSEVETLPQEPAVVEAAPEEESLPVVSKIDESPPLVVQEAAPPPTEADELAPAPVPAVAVKAEVPDAPPPALPQFRPPVEPAPVVKAAPQPPAELEPLPALLKVKVVRRHFLNDEELRKQLLAAPALTLDPAAAPAGNGGANASGGVFDPSTRNGKRPVQLTVNLLRQRPDLVGLSVRMGNDCRLGKEAAENLQFLSRKLREHMLAAAKDGDPRKAEDQLRRLLLTQERRSWVQAEAIPTLEQMLQVENKPIRLLLVEILTQISDPSASTALARRALFDLSAEVREAAIQSLAGRAKEEFRTTLLEGLRYPWAAVADHASEALVALDDHAVVPQLMKMVEQPDPNTGFVVLPQPKRTPVSSEPPTVASQIDRPTLMVREMVRINHLGNCMMCHAASGTSTDLVRGLVPDPNNAIQTSLPYYSGDTGSFVRADMTYLKQDFSVPQPVEKPGPWPQLQRYDYLVRTRPAVPADAEGKAVSRQREALLHALSKLEPDWKSQRQR